MALVNINPRQIWLNTINSAGINGTFSIRNEDSFNAGSITSLGTARMSRHPNATFNGASSTPLFIHSVASNNGSGAHFPIYISEVNWIDPSTGGFKASSVYASNYAIATGIPNLTQFDWMVVANPSTIAPPVSASVDYATSRTVYTSSDSALQLRDNNNASNPGVVGYSDPYSMGNPYTISGLNLIMRSSIETTGVANTLTYKFTWGYGSTLFNSVYYVNTVTNTLTTMKRRLPIYCNSTNFRTDGERYTRTS